MAWFALWARMRQASLMALGLFALLCVSRAQGQSLGEIARQLRAEKAAQQFKATTELVKVIAPLDPGALARNVLVQRFALDVPFPGRDQWEAELFAAKEGLVRCYGEWERARKAEAPASSLESKAPSAGGTKPSLSQELAEKLVQQQAETFLSIANDGRSRASDVTAKAQRQEQAKKADEPGTGAQQVYTDDGMHRTPGGSRASIPVGSPKQSQRLFPWKDDVDSFTKTMDELGGLDREKLGKRFIAMVDPKLAGQPFPGRSQWEISLFDAKQQFVEAAVRYVKQWESCKDLGALQELARDSRQGDAGKLRDCIAEIERTHDRANRARIELLSMGEKIQKAAQAGKSWVPLPPPR